jgi:succinate dehydrogenase / fumarate reductase, cytochrome b subunit
MSPSTQVALIALILFFAVVAVSILWPRLTELKRSNMKLPSAIVPATIKVFRSAPLEVEAAPQGRPLSPDLRTDRWIWPTSTQHRIASGALCFGAILLLAFWLISRDRAQRFFGSPLGVAILFVYTLVLMQYVAVGVRHFIWKVGYGAEPEMRRNMIRATPMAAVLLTSLIWVGVQLHYGRPPSLPDASARTAAQPQNGMSDRVMAHESARRDYDAAQSELARLAAATRKVADELRAEPLGVDLSVWPSREQLAEALRKVRTARGELRGAWESVPPDMRPSLEPPPSD